MKENNISKIEDCSFDILFDLINLGLIGEISLDDLPLEKFDHASIIIRKRLMTLINEIE